MAYYNTSKTRKKVKGSNYYLRNAVRIFMGLLFIFSAYVKMVDPFGFGLKLEEYFASFGMAFMSPTAIYFAFAACLAEFIIGWAMLLNIQMRFTSWCLLLFMAFFTLLTFWLAYALDIIALINKWFNTNYELFVVTDCGCFGDFIKLDNKETFYKNVVFMALTLIVFSNRKRFKVQPWYYITQWLPIVLVGCLGLFIMLKCFLHEPWHDFRPWKKGAFIAAETYSEAPELDFLFKYRHNSTGEFKELSIDNLATISNDSLGSIDFETNYSYVDRVEKVIKKGINARLADFTILDPLSNKDIKNHVIANPEYNFIIFIRDMVNLDAKNITNVNKLINDCNQQCVDFVIITSTPIETADSVKKQLSINAPLYICDETAMKTAIRNTPGVILLKEGYIIDKWAYRDLPTLNQIEQNFEKYGQKLEKYIKKNPPVLPNGSSFVVENEEETTTQKQAIDSNSIIQQ